MTQTIYKNVKYTNLLVVTSDHIRMYTTIQHPTVLLVLIRIKIPTLPNEHMEPIRGSHVAFLNAAP